MNSTPKRQGESSGRAFTTTSWSMVVRAAAPDSPESVSALAELCDSYWYPLYTFVRRKGYDRADAEDLTQSFFAELLEKRQIGVADQQRGRFRTFLLTALEHFIANRWRSDHALKRGGDVSTISFDFESADEKYTTEPFHTWTAEKIFERNWALAVLSNALDGVRQQYSANGKSELFEQLKVFLGDGRQVSYKSLGEEIGSSEGAVKVAVHRLRERYGEQLRIQIAKTVDSTTDVQNELHSLVKALGNGE